MRCWFVCVLCMLCIELFVCVASMCLLVCDVCVAKRRWFSGKISRCHRDAPGSIPGRRILLCFALLIFCSPGLVRPSALFCAGCVARALLFLLPFLRFLFVTFCSRSPNCRPKLYPPTHLPAGPTPPSRSRPHKFVRVRVSSPSPSRAIRYGVSYLISSW